MSAAGKREEGESRVLQEGAGQGREEGESATASCWRMQARQKPWRQEEEMTGESATS